MTFLLGSMKFDNKKHTVNKKDEHKYVITFKDQYGNKFTLMGMQSDFDRYDSESILNPSELFKQSTLES